MIGDVYLFHTPDGGNIAFRKGEPLEDTGLETAIYISIFSYGWWANPLVETNERMESSLESLLSNTLTPTTLRAIQDAVKEAIKWTIGEGIVTSTGVSVEALGRNSVSIEVTLNRPKDLPVTYKFFNNWEGQEIIPAHRK